MVQDFGLGLAEIKCFYTRVEGFLNKQSCVPSKTLSKPSETGLKNARFAVWNRLSAQQDLKLLQVVPHPVHLLAKSDIYVHLPYLSIR